MGFQQWNEEKGEEDGGEGAGSSEEEGSGNGIVDAEMAREARTGADTGVGSKLMMSGDNNIGEDTAETQKGESGEAVRG